ncbi:hypothetical protein IV102_02520 [bacterium]|nr:hypothetical protein [bacterium]
MVFFSATSPDHVTDLPAFNDFQMAVFSVLEGHSSEEDASRLYLQLDTTLGQVLYYYYEQVHFQPLEEQSEQRSSQIYSLIDLIREESALAFKASLTDNQTATSFHLEGAREYLGDLMKQFAELRREEEKRPKFSDLAWVNELCRVAVACRQGQLSDDHLAERLETAQQLHERAALGIPQMPPLITDRQRWRQILAVMVEALETLGQGIGQVDAYLDDHDGDGLDAGLELCMSGAQRLLEEYETLCILEDEVPTRLCPRCSHSNPLEATRCGSCSATFPRLPEEEAADLQVSWPSYVERLLHSLHSWRQGEMNLEQAVGALVELRGRFQKGLASFQQMKMPAQGVPDEIQRVGDARARLIADSERALAGLNDIQAALEEGQADFVNTATENFLAGVQGLLEAHQLGQQLVG